MKGTFFIEVHGCQMNVYDSRRIVDSLVSFGYSQVSSYQDADILIFYTCNIREKAAKRLYSNIGRYKGPRTKVIAVGGCVAQAEGEDVFKNAKSVNIVFGPQVYHQLADNIWMVLSGSKERIISTELKNLEKFGCLPKRGRTLFSEYVTIQEGCDNFCTYCVVPYTRGREHSRPAIDIINEVRELVAAGAQEITLLGQNVNSYHGEAAYISIGQPRGTWRLERLIREIAEIDGLRRLRYTTSHPKDFTKELMEIHAQIPVLAPFAHIPVQSGSDRILKLMNRGHTAQEYLDKLAMFRDICQNIQFSSDFIVGFPTETDQDFEDTLNVVRQAKYTISYSFKYSRRKNTPAYSMDGQIDEKTKEDRLKILQELLIKDQVYWNERLVGQQQEVLFERHGKRKNQYIGKNSYLQSIIVESPIDIIGQFKNVIIKSSGENSAIGEIV